MKRCGVSLVSVSQVHLPKVTDLCLHAGADSLDGFGQCETQVCGNERIVPVHASELLAHEAL